MPPDSLVLRSQRAGRGWIRLDLFVDGSVKEAQTHFLESLPKEDVDVLTSEYEGFDAEVYFIYKQKYVGSVQVVDRCGDGVLVAVRLERAR